MEGKFYIFMVTAIIVTILFALLIWIQTYIFQRKGLRAKKDYEKFLEQLAIEKAQASLDNKASKNEKQEEEL